MKIIFLTLFPDFFITPLQQSILKRAQQKSAVEYQIVNIRDYATDKHQTTDDRPFGGGPGMVMKVEPIDLALAAVRQPKQTGVNKALTVLTSAKGTLFTQSKAREYAQLDELIIICGHYEGVDQRVADHLADEEVRVGDYVLTGGEPAALVMADAVTRLLPGVLGNEVSLADESHSVPGVLGYPQYTRPEVYKNWPIPAVLLGGHHAQIKTWRQNKKVKK